MRKTAVYCDHCGDEFPDSTPAKGVTSAMITIGGNGAAEDKFGPVDLCNGCYSGIHSMLRIRTSAAPTGKAA